MSRHIFPVRALAVFFAGCFFAATASAAEAKLVASDYSDRYHLSTCKVAQKIHPEERLVFQTPEEAAERGLVPCKKCNPPVAEKYQSPASSFVRSKADDTDT